MMSNEQTKNHFRVLSAFNGSDSKLYKRQRVCFVKFKQTTNTLAFKSVCRLLEKQMKVMKFSRVFVP